MAIFIPKKINVGFQERNDTYTGKLAYVIYFDEKGKLRKETSWQNWRDKNITNEIYNNEPTEGFVLNKKVGGDRYGWNPRQTYTRVYDPRGFEFEITIPNLLYILENCNCIKGKGLEGEFVYGWDGKELILIPIESPDYKSIQRKTKIIYDNSFVKPTDLKVGVTYEDFNGVQYVYMGKSKPWERQTNCYHEPLYRYSFQKDENFYKYPINVDNWKVSIVESCVYNEKPTYYRNNQSIKNEFFFIKLGNNNAEHSWNRKNSVIHMPYVKKKFTNIVCEERTDFKDMIDLLYRNQEYCPNDYSADKILDLPFENFLSMADTVIKVIQEERYNFYFTVGILENGFMKRKNIFYLKGQSLWYINEKDINTQKIIQKSFDSLKECYDYVHPVYGEQYLQNGYLKRRVCYDTES